MQKIRLKRRLTLSHDNEPFLERWGFCHERFGGFYLHKIAAPDPGMDLHDHPWTFVSIILSGGYTEQRTNTPASTTEPLQVTHGRFGVNRMPLNAAHRITDTKPGTWTLVFRGPTRRVWGFYVDGTWIDWRTYDYETRRPSTVEGNKKFQDVPPNSTVFR